MHISKISISEYDIKKTPDWKSVGEKIDVVLKKNFMGQRLVIRCIGSSEHKGKTIEGLVRIIRRYGTDRYNLKRKGQKYANVGNKQIDFFALDRTVTPKAKIMWQFVWSFYHFPKLWGQKPVKIDLIILYDRKKLKSVRYTEDGKRFKQDGFVFKDSENKPVALKGIIKLNNF